MTEIETDRLILRRLRDTDGPEVVRYLDDLETARKLSRVPHPYSLENWDWFMENVVRGETEDIFALTDKQDGRFMGVISYQIGRNEPILGYWLGKPFRAKGYMKEAAIAFTRYGFEAHDAPSFISGHFEDNPISSRVLIALGYEAFETSLETSLARGEEQIPHITMRLMRERFAQLHPSG